MKYLNSPFDLHHVLKMILCWVDSNLWTCRAPDFRPWECVQDSNQRFFPKFKIMTSVYFIGKNRWQVATGKKKLAPDRSGNVMVSPENILLVYQKDSRMAFQSVVLTSGQKMVLRVVYEVICELLWREMLSAPSFDRYWKQPIGRP